MAVIKYPDKRLKTEDAFGHMVSEFSPYYVVARSEVRQNSRVGDTG